MTRSTLSSMLAGSVAVVFAAGCLGSVGEGGGGDGGKNGDKNDLSVVTPAMVAANVKADFVANVQPLLVGDCGTCHSSTTNQPGPGFLAGPDRYTSFVQYPGMVGPSPASSRILLKDPHEDPTTYHMNSTYTPSATLQAHAKVISAWIVEYNAAGSAVQPDMGVQPSVAPFAITDGQTKTIDLSTLNSALTGTTMSFNIHLLGTPPTLVQLSNILITPSATIGVDLKTPLFSLYNAGATATSSPELVDYDYLSDEFIAYPGTPAPFDPPLDIIAYTPGQLLGIQVDSIAKSTGSPDMGGSTGACKNVTGFSTFKTELTGSLSLNCYSCHKAGGSGNGAFDLSEIMTAADDATSCATVLLESVPATPNTSPVYLAPTGGQTHQGGTITASQDAGYLTALTTWLNGEK
jgi:mono/diheme cytochrome c family protein